MKSKTKTKIKKGIIKKPKPFKPIIDADDQAFICANCLEESYEGKHCIVCGKGKFCWSCFDPEFHQCDNEVSA